MRGLHSHERFAGRGVAGSSEGMGAVPDHGGRRLKIVRAAAAKNFADLPRKSGAGTSHRAAVLHLSVTNKETAMEDLIQTTLTRAAALLTEAATSLQEASAEAAAGKADMARGGSEFALGSARRALALIEACHTIQAESRGL